MTRASALTPTTETPHVYGPDKEFGAVVPATDNEAPVAHASAALPAAEAVPTQELVPTGPPRTPLHIEVKNLVAREDAREIEVRLLNDRVASLERDIKELDLLWQDRFDGLAQSHGALLERVRALGDWVDAPSWTP